MPKNNSRICDLEIGDTFKFISGLQKPENSEDLEFIVAGRFTETDRCSYEKFEIICQLKTGELVIPSKLRVCRPSLAERNMFLFPSQLQLRYIDSMGGAKEFQLGSDKSVMVDDNLKTKLEIQR